MIVALLIHAFSFFFCLKHRWLTTLLSVKHLLCNYCYFSVCFITAVSRSFEKHRWPPFRVCVSVSAFFFSSVFSSTGKIKNRSIQVRVFLISTISRYVSAIFRERTKKIYRQCKGERRKKRKIKRVLNNNRQTNGTSLSCIGSKRDLIDMLRRFEGLSRSLEEKT